MFHVVAMEGRRKTARLPESERRELLREGRAVLLSLGEGRLANEYCRLAETKSTREEMAELLVTCIVSRHSR
ncbi:hypothetical protein [Desulfovibrio sp. TomC]|uniref:hypothetical protein n=1 Tax=Desulfovibrio sp. TomC TaxID=1562888 RepID=UPI0005747538|nr:hypothetical protein [Desulfovibrio sp. TomC]KHK03978.1 hypothetical protein NY78_0420 [Desulfovibrio sp. TomC]